MKQRIITIIAMLLLAIGMQAQSDLAVGTVFNKKVIPQKEMIETSVRASALNRYKLNLYRSLRFTPDAKNAATVRLLFQQDARQATGNYTLKRGRHSRKTIISLPPKGGKYRYLALNEHDKEMTLVYMEGTVSSIRELRELLEK